MKLENLTKDDQRFLQLFVDMKAVFLRIFVNALRDIINSDALDADKMTEAISITKKYTDGLSTLDNLLKVLTRDNE